MLIARGRLYGRASRQPPSCQRGSCWTLAAATPTPRRSGRRCPMCAWSPGWIPGRCSRARTRSSRMAASGTTLGAVAAGLPLVLVPLFGTSSITPARSKRWAPAWPFARIRTRRPRRCEARSTPRAARGGHDRARGVRHLHVASELSAEMAALPPTDAALGTRSAECAAGANACPGSTSTSALAWRRDVLRSLGALEPLLEALAGVERLVLLGDVVEPFEGRPRVAMEVAELVLRAIGGRLEPGVEVILVPGNHDGELIGPAPSRRNGVSPAVDAELPVQASLLLERMAAWLEPATAGPLSGRLVVRAHGATHGHYLDRHLLPETAFGVARAARAAAARRRPPDRLRARRRPVDRRVEAKLTRGPPRPLAALVDDLFELFRAATMPRMFPVTVRLLGTQMRRASIPALARVVHVWSGGGLGHLGSRAPQRPAAGGRPARLGGPRRSTAHRQHRKLGLRAVAGPPRHAAAPVPAWRRRAP